MNSRRQIELTTEIQEDASRLGKGKTRAQVARRQRVAGAALERTVYVFYPVHLKGRHFPDGGSINNKPNATIL